VPERRHDYINQVRRRQSGGVRDGLAASERLMYPFAIAHKSGPGSKVYTLCVATPSARDQWKEKIENAKAIRRYDVESNRAYAIHTVYIPREISVQNVITADTFSWLGRESIAIAVGKSVWMGWRRDSHCRIRSDRDCFRADVKRIVKSFAFRVRRTKPSPLLP
jgi:hypothetical protein